MTRQLTLNFKLRFDAFLDFYQSHRDVYEKFEELAIRMRESRERYAARTIIEVIRWNTHLGGGADFKINNNHIPYLGRLAMLRNPCLADFFELRPSRHDVKDAELLKECNRIDQELRNAQRNTKDRLAVDV